MLALKPDHSKSLLNWWFNEPHLQDDGVWRAAGIQVLGFAQREALETIVPSL